MGFPEFVVVIASIMALNPLAMDMMLPALPNIASAFHITIANEPQAVLSTFLIGFGVGQFIMGPLSDRFGRRPVLIDGMALYCIASVLAITAPSPGPFGFGPNLVFLGDGNHDTVFSSGFDIITVGKGNDSIHVGTNDTVTVGTGQDTFAFDWTAVTSGGVVDQTKPGGIGNVSITGFDPSKDVIVLQQALQSTNPYSVHDDPVTGNAVITFQHDTLDSITLVGVHSAALHASDFHLV